MSDENDNNGTDTNVGTATAVADEGHETLLELPDRNQVNSSTSRKTFYLAGTNNISVAEIDGQEREVATRFDAVRIIRLSVRPQQARNRQMLVLTMGLILDGLQVKLIDDDGNQVPHPMLSDPRYAAYRSLPHRINAQQWMDTANLDKAVEFASYLQANKSFRIDRNPTNPQGSQRKTKDLFQARPIQPLNPDKPENFGATVDGFEVSVNPDYEQGFSSFYQGLTEQQERWESASAEEDPQDRAERLEALRNNLHFVGGVYHDDENRSYWARPVDIGIIKLDDIQFPFYPIQGDTLDLGELMTALQGAGETGGDTGGEQPLEVAGGPPTEELQRF